VRLRLLQEYHRKHGATSAREAPLAYRRYQAPLALGINLFFPALADQFRKGNREILNENCAGTS
jgi:hypothetical protein